MFLNFWEGCRDSIQFTNGLSSSNYQTSWQPEEKIPYEKRASGMNAGQINLLTAMTDLLAAPVTTLAVVADLGACLHACFDGTKF